MKSLRISGAILSVIGMILIGSVGATAAGGDGPSKGDKSDKVNISEASRIAPDPSELALPMIDENMSQLASGLTEQFHDDPQFASAEVPASRERVIIHWHGEKTEQLSALINQHSSVPFDLRQTRFLPGALRQRAASLAKSEAAVMSFDVNHDGSGIQVTLTSDALKKKSASEYSHQFQEASGVPTSVSGASPIKANNRQFDTGYHIGGSRLYQPATGGGCSSGFAVRQSGTDRQGIMFAAHCGSVGTEWAVYDGGQYYYTWGSTVARNTTFDGAIIDSGWSQEYVWNGTYNTTTIAPIRGDTYPFVGQEVCYSGGYSGTKCGNMVQTTSTTYNLGGDLTAVNGFRTEQINGEPAAGNGDSGGPGYSFVSDSNGYAKRLAVGIISAIPSNSGTTCQGIPGDAYRKCSSTVYSTAVSSISSYTGWYVPTYQ